MNIETLLKKQGFSERKIKVYLAVLALGRATTLQVSRRTGIKRTSAYDILLDLIREGYLTEITVGKKRLITAEHPEQVLARTEEKITDTRLMVQQLLTIYNQTTTRPDIHFYEGAANMKNIMEDMLLMKGKENRYWGSTADLVDLFGTQYVHQYVKRRIARGIWSITLLTQKRRIPQELSASDDKFLRRAFWLPKQIIFSGSLCLYDDKVAYISSEKESFGFILKSKELATLLGQIFDTMWLTAEESDRANKSKGKTSTQR